METPRQMEHKYRQIDLLRHGEPVGGRAYRGNRIDDPLSEKGWQQMWAAMPTEVQWQHIVTSPLVRCRDFADVLAEKYKLPLTVEKDFREVGFGDWEGRTADEIIAQTVEEYNAFYHDPVNNRPPGAEALKDFIHRVSKAYNNLLQTIPAERILVVAHAGVIRAIITKILDSPPATMYRIRIANAGLVRIRIGPYGPVLEMPNGNVVN